MMMRRGDRENGRRKKGRPDFDKNERKYKK